MKQHIVVFNAKINNLFLTHESNEKLMKKLRPLICDMQ